MDMDFLYSYLLQKSFELTQAGLNQQEKLLLFQYLDTEHMITAPQIKARPILDLALTGLDSGNINKNLNSLVTKGLAVRIEKLESVKPVRWINAFRATLYDDLPLEQQSGLSRQK